MARAQCLTSPGSYAINWTDATGNWTTASNWSLNCAPYNVNGGSGVTYAVTIDSSSANVTLDSTSNPTSITVDSLALEAGGLDIGSGATLDLANQPAGITDIPAGAGLTVAGTLTAGANSALANLGSVEGTLTLQGQTLTATPGTGTFSNSGIMNLQQATALTISGDLTNSNTISTGNFASTGNNSLTVSGTLTNNGGIYMDGTGDSV